MELLKTIFHAEILQLIPLAISLNIKEFGKLIDNYNGYDDVQNKVIKTPLDPLKYI